MQYINPIEILGLSNAADTTSIDNEIVKKTKRKLFADIDLSDNGHFEYYGLELTKGDCEKAIDELANNDLKEFYLYLASNKKLNNFLVNGNDEVFTNFKQDSIFKLPKFIKFISPYFAPKFDKALLNAFENKNVEQTKAILNTSSLIFQANINTAYKSVSNNIQNKISEIDEITKDIKNEESIYDENDIEDVIDLVKEHFPSKIINCLPLYFQSQILKIAKSINFLQLSIWDAFDNSQVPNDLLEHLLTLNIGGLDKPTFESNYKIVKKKNDERIEQEKNLPILRKYAKFIIESKNKIQEIKDTKFKSENHASGMTWLQIWVNSEISISEINNLPETFEEIKNQIALILKILSVENWNSYSSLFPHKALEVSINLINKANSITGLQEQTKQNIQDAQKQLNELKVKIDFSSSLVPTSPTAKTTTPTIPKNKNSNSNSDSFGYWKIGVGILILFFIIGRCSKNSNDSTIEAVTESVNSSDTSAVEEVSYPIIDSTATDTVESLYLGNQLKDGESPLTGCFGKGIYSGNATLTIKNGGNSDAIICLYSISDDRTIRNEYVQKNSSFKMSNIAQGEYKIKVFYGNDWNPDLENSCGTKGNFESDVNFSEFDGTEYFEDSERGFTSATITLYTVEGGNASSSAIDQSQFFSK
jgi:hypothetical protein